MHALRAGDLQLEALRGRVSFTESTDLLAYPASQLEGIVAQIVQTERPYSVYFSKCKQERGFRKSCVDKVYIRDRTFCFGTGPLEIDFKTSSTVVQKNIFRFQAVLTG